MNNMTPTPFIGGTTPNFDTLTVDNWISGANGGPLTLLSWPVGPMDATPVSWVEDVLNGFVPTISSALPPSPAPGKLWFNSLDGQLYIWYNDPNSSQWVIANNTGIQDAPIGTITYGRQNRTWVPALALSGGIMTGPLVLHNDPTAYFMAATKGYVDLAVQAYLPLTGGTITGQLTLSLEPVVAHQAANKAYVDLHSGTVIISDVAPSNPIPGQLWFDSTGVQLYIWYLDGAGVWAQVGAPAFTAGTSGGGAGGAFPEAPVDGRIYGRNGQLQSWAPVLPILGGQMAGPIILVNSSPVLDDEAASKRYVEDVVATAMLWQGNYNVALNQPDLTTVTPLLNGYSWTTVTQDPAVPELLTISLPGLPPGTTVFNGDLLRYTAPAGIWFVARGSGLTKTEADATFVFRSGDTMTGELYLAADPVDPLEAATMRYVEAQRVVISSLPPANPFEGQLWFDLQNPNMYIWVIDATSAQWVAAMSPPVFGGGIPFVDFIFPANPNNGDIATAPNGQSWVWNASDQRWEAIHPYVLRVGDNMTGALDIVCNDISAYALRVNNTAAGPGLLVITNSVFAAATMMSNGSGNVLDLNKVNAVGVGLSVSSNGAGAIDVNYSGTGSAIDISATSPVADAINISRGYITILDGGIFARRPSPGSDWNNQSLIIQHSALNGGASPSYGWAGIGFSNFNTTPNGGARYAVLALDPNADQFVLLSGMAPNTPIGLAADYVILSTDPTQPLQAATKAYVDANAGGDRVLKTGDTMTGDLTFSSLGNGIRWPLGVSLASPANDFVQLNAGTFSVAGALSVSGMATAQGGVTVRSSITNGMLQLHTGSTTQTGEISFYTPENTRRGYIGYGSANVLHFKAESGYRWQFDDALTGTVSVYNGAGSGTAAFFAQGTVNNTAATSSSMVFSEGSGAWNAWLYSYRQGWNNRPEAQLRCDTAVGGWGNQNVFNTTVDSPPGMYFQGNVSCSSLTQRSARDNKRGIRAVDAREVNSAWDGLQVRRFRWEDTPIPPGEDGVPLANPSPPPLQPEKFGFIVDELPESMVAYAAPGSSNPAEQVRVKEGWDVGDMIALTVARVKQLEMEIAELRRGG